MASEAFTPSELEALNSQLPSVSGSPENRFIQACILYYQSWLKVRASSNVLDLHNTQALVLIYSESPTVESIIPSEDAHPPKRVFKTSAAIDNGLVICNENLNTIYQWIPSFEGINEALNFVHQKIGSERCFVIILLGQRRMFVHHPGQDMEEWCNEPYIITVDHNKKEITPDAIADQVIKFHDECTKAYRGSLARFMWNKETGDLAEAPEKKVQTGLLIHFRAWLQDEAVVIDEEVDNPNGRMDIRIARLAPIPPVTVNTVLELKVLKPSESANRHTEWAISGVTQADSYRNQQTDACLACIFDARKDKTVALVGLREKAEELKVRLSQHEMELPPPATVRPKKRKGG